MSSAHLSCYGFGDSQLLQHMLLGFGPAAERPKHNEDVVQHSQNVLPSDTSARSATRCLDLDSVGEGNCVGWCPHSISVLDIIQRL
jgi:hypothetical protein